MPQLSAATLENITADLIDRGLESALKRVAHIGTPSCFKLRRRIFSAHPFLSNSLSHSYLRIAEEKNYRDANAELQNLHESLIIHDFNASFEPSEVKTFSQKIASHCAQKSYESSDTHSAYNTLCSIVKRYQINPPEPKNNMFSPCVSLMSDEHWWLRRLNTLKYQLIEEVARKIGLVQKYASTYSSSIAQQARKHQKAKHKEYLENHYISNEFGQTFSLKDLFNKNVSNPVIRRTELMVRLKGFEEISELMGHASEFLTITAPSCMHARSSKTGLKNKYFNGSTVRRAHKLLHSQGRCAIAKLKRQKIEVYGFRVVEPHHDGTPHFHWLLFMKSEHRDIVRKTFKEYALRDMPNEKGANKYRFKAEAINKAKGGATSYIAKYISKNIDGLHIEDDHNGNSGNYAAQAIDAWASIHKIRQFQQIGGHSVTIWRELRRLANSPNSSFLKAPNFDRLLQAADSGNWAAYTLAMGGPFRGSDGKPVLKAYYEAPDSIDVQTGEILKESLTQHGDFKAPRLKGVIYMGITVFTRIYEWTLVKDPPSDGLIPNQESAPQGPDP